MLRVIGEFRGGFLGVTWELKRLCCISGCLLVGSGLGTGRVKMEVEKYVGRFVWSSGSLI